MEKKKGNKKVVKIVALLLCLAVVFGTLIFLFMPPSVNNYSMYMQLNCFEEGTMHMLQDNQEPFSISKNDELNIYCQIVNKNARWKWTKFSDGELLKVTIYKGEEKIFEKGDDCDGTYTFPWRVGCRCYSDYYFEASYAFTEAGTYTVVLTSNFRQLWKSYSYTADTLTVVVQ